MWAWVAGFGQQFPKLALNSLLEADLQNCAVYSDQPAGPRAGEGDRPEAGDAVERVPGFALVGCPGGASRVGGDHDCAVVVVVVTRVASPVDVGQPENCSGDRRWIGKRPGAATITRGCRAGIVGIGRIEIASADDAVIGIAEGDGEGAGAGVADERRVIGVPGVAAIGGREDSCCSGATGGDPGIAPAFGRYAGTAGCE